MTDPSDLMSNFTEIDLDLELDVPETFVDTVINREETQSSIIDTLKKHKILVGTLILIFLHKLYKKCKERQEKEKRMIKE